MRPAAIVEKHQIGFQFKRESNGSSLTVVEISLDFGEESRIRLPHIEPLRTSLDDFPD